jgi:hypothetical protein
MDDMRHIQHYSIYLGLGLFVKLDVGYYGYGRNIHRMRGLVSGTDMMT